jgi:hypothetical protein
METYYRKQDDENLMQNEKYSKRTTQHMTMEMNYIVQGNGD